MKKSFGYSQVRLLFVSLILLGIVFSAISWPAPAGASQSVYVLDNFTTATYNNQNGTSNWATDWVENNDTGVADTGDVRIIGGVLRLNNNLTPTTLPSVERGLSMPLNATATLSFYRTVSGLGGGGDTAILEIYDGDTAAWATLQTYNTNAARALQTIDISGYRSFDTRLRFRITGGYAGATEYLLLDDVQVTYQANLHFPSSVFQTVQTYYVPIPEDQGLLALNAINTDADDPMNTYISITVVADDTVIYYDHWEDDYETKTTNPSQITTEVWGDDNPANGMPPGFGSDVFIAGNIIILNNAVPSTNLLQLDYDGGDKISSTDAIAVTRTAWPSGAGTLHGGSVEMLNTDVWGLSYDIPADSGDQANDFDYAGLSVMASQDNTLIYLNGTQVMNMIGSQDYLDEGQSYLFGDGTIVGGDTITSDKPIQANFLTGDIGSNYESSWFTLYPYALLSSSYYAPVDGTTTPARTTAVYLQNPTANPITIYRMDSSGTENTVVTNLAAGATHRYTMPTTGTGMTFYTKDSARFQAISNMDSGGQASDWGYTLIPSNQLTQQAQLGWGVGRDPTSGTNPNENGSPAWVLAVGAGTMNVCVDYDGDGLGALTDANGSRYDQLLTVTNLQRTKVYDSDGDQTGMLLYLCNGSESANNRSNKIAVAWGQDPVTASAAAPGLDVGTSVPPLPNFTAIKNAVLTNDLNGDGKFDIGDTFEYQIKINNVGALPIPGNLITVSDIIPTYTNYYPNSTRIDGVSIPDAVIGTPFPLDEGGYLISGTLPIDGQFVVTFRVTIDASIPAATNLINNALVSDKKLTYIPKVEIFIDPPTKIGDFIWLDQNGDGVQDAGEPGLAGVTVFLDTNNNGTWNAGEPTTTTNSSGQYTFSGLSGGTYYVVVDTSTLPGGLTQTGDPDTTIDNKHTVTIGPGSTNKPYYAADFGYRGAIALGDFVWYDVDRDGIQDGGAEVGLDGVTVNLTWAGKDGNLATTADNIVFPAKVTSGGGAYSFVGLPNGIYQVNLDETSLPSNYSTTTADPITTASLTGNYLTADFGAAPGATISDFVWNDLDADGVQDAGEGGISGVRVYLDADNDNTYDVGERYATTDANGLYAITNLPAATLGTTYAVRVDTSTLPTTTYTRTYDLDGIGTLDEASATVTPGQVRTDVDFGYQLGVLSISKSSSIGDQVFPGDTITYTMVVRNNSGTTQTGIVVTDSLPIGTSYVANSTLASGYVETIATYRDNFGTAVYNNSDGTQSWMGNSWIEAGETTSPTANQIVITGGELRFQGTSAPNSIERQFNISGATSATLTYDCRASANHDEGADDFVVLAISSDGGLNWTNLATQSLGAINNSNCGAGFESFNILSYAAANTRIRFTHTASTTDEYFYVDNFQVQYTTAPATTKDNISGGTYADLYNGVPAVLVHQNDAFQLTNGQQMTITYRVTVIDPVRLSSIDNTAVVSSAQQLTPQVASVSDPLPRSAAGDYVWLDENSDGIQDAGEPGIPNTTVTLTGTDVLGNTVSWSTVTDANGRYLFPNLLPSNGNGYTVTVSGLPTGLSANPTYDENGIGTPNTTNFILNAATERMTADFGYNWAATTDTNNNTGTGAIGDRVWIDDGDGLQEPGEPGLYNVTVNLQTAGADGLFGTADDVTAATTTTGYDGRYIFDGLAAGSYRVFIPTTPAGYAQTGDPDNYGTTGATDNLTTTPIVLGPGDTFVNADFGYQPTAGQRFNIGDTLWVDSNRDGNSAGEPVLPGVSVSLVRDLNGNGLWDSGEPVIATDITDASGQYLFTNLPYTDGIGTDDYLVWVNDTANILGELTPVYDSNGSATPNISAVTNFGPADNLAQDFGYAPSGHDSGESLIGDTVFYDNNNNGSYQVGEGLEGVRVNLYTDVNSNGVWDAGDTLLSSTRTNENGQYFFGGLTTNGVLDFVVKIETASLPAGVTNTVDPGSAAPLNESAVVNMAANSANYAQDFGHRDTSSPNSISGTLWRDTDVDGALDVTEAARLAGVTVVLRNSSGNIVASTTTDVNGNYTFNNLPDGTFTVDVTDDSSLLNGYWKSSGAAGNGTANGTTAGQSQSDPYTVSVNGTDGRTATVDFGYYRESASVGDFVWSDLNGNGVQDSGEPGISGGTVTLTITWPGAAGTTILTTTTDGAGAYSFGNLLLDEDFDGAGLGEPTFLVTFSTPSGYTVTLEDQGGNEALDSDGLTETVSPVEGQAVTNVDSGFIQNRQGVIGDRVWLDEDGDGDQDAGESGIPNVRVFLDTDNDGVYDVGETFVYTDAEGGYVFKNLNSGSYNLAIDPISLPAGLNNFTYDENDGSTNPNGRTPVSLGNGQEYLTADFGLNWATPTETNANTGTGMIGDRLWIDDGDGNQEPGEPGLAGITVQLRTPGADGIFGTADDYGPDLLLGTADDVVATITSTTTNQAGNYSFDGLAAGGYLVYVPNTPSGYSQTGDPDGTLDNRTTAPVVLGPGDVYLNADFGYQPAAGQRFNIGDTLWLDTNRDGVVDSAATEPRLSAVTVALIRDTNGDGLWDADGVDNISGNADDEPIIAQDVTDANGQYLFTNLPYGDGIGTDDYLVWVNDTANLLAELTPVYDSNGIGTPNISAVTDFGPADNLAQDFGYAPAGHDAGERLIGDTVFYDNNANGTYQAGEGLEGVRVNLYLDANADGNYDAGETLLAATFTDENGQYFFGGLAAGRYVVRIDTSSLPSGVTNTVDVGDATLNEGGADLTVATSNLDVDFGYRDTSSPNSVGGTIWRDTNADGALSGESGIFENVIVVLRNGSGNIIATTVTDASGNYNFANLPDGSYTVDVTDENNVLDGYWHSLGTQDEADDNQSKTDAYTINLSSGENRATVDFGYYRDPASLGDRVWLDVNGNGIQDTDGNDNPEPSLPNAKVTLTITYPGGAGTITLVTYTDSNGLYSFGNLLLDEDFNLGGGVGEPAFQITFEGYGLTPTQTGQGNANTDSNGQSVAATVIQGANNISYDSGFTGNLDLGDLPDLTMSSLNYPTRYSPGPAHVVFPGSGNVPATYTDGRIAVWLGTIVDTESNGVPRANASGDDAAGTTDDEDGLVLDAAGWTAGAGTGGSFPPAPKATITLNSSNDCDINPAGKQVYYGFWIDWNPGDNLSTFDAFYSGSGVSCSPVSVLVDVPVPATYVPDSNVYMRLRASESPLDINDYEGTIVNGEVEDYWFTFTSGGVTTPVTLSYFRAERQGTGVVFDWSTATETGNVGFNLYVAKGKEKTLINSQLIPSKVIDSLEVQNYSYSAQLNGSVFYIEDVSILGETELHGPFVLGRAYGARLTNAPINLAAIQAEHERKDDQRQEQLSDAMVVPAEALAPVEITTPVVRTDRGIPDRIVRPKTPMPVSPVKPVKPTKTPRRPAPTATLTPTATATNQPTYTPSATLTSEPSYTPSATPTWTLEPTLTVELSATVEESLEPTATDETENLVTPTETETPQESASATPTETETETPSPTVTATATETETPTETATATETETPTVTATPTETEIPTETATATETALPTATATPTEVSAQPVLYDPADLQLSTTFNLKVNKTGLYRVTYEQLQTAGLDLAGVPLEKLTVLNRDKMIPIYVSMPDQSVTFGAGGYIEFYGEALDTLYTDTNIYILQVNASPAPRVRMDNTVPDASLPAPVSYQETLVVNNQRQFANYAPDVDKWYDTSMLAYTSAKSWNYTFVADGLANGGAGARMEVIVWGVTNWPESPDHHLLVSVNGMQLGDEYFDGLVEKTFTFNLPAGLLREGANTLTLTLPGDTGVKWDMVNFDKLILTYPREFRAKEGQQQFHLQGDVFTVTGLPASDVIVYRLDGTSQVRLQQLDLAAASDGLFRATFAGSGQPASYLVTTVSVVRQPKLEATRTASKLNQRAEYLIIAHPQFIEGLQPLVNARRAEGLSVDVVNVEDLYTQYSYGIFDPQAIRAHIRYAAANLGVRYVLLVGGDTYDYRNYTGKNSLSFIPSLYIATGPIARFVPVDPLYTDLNGDNLPDLAIGRFPVRSRAELDLMVRKTLAYQDKAYGKTALFVSDKLDPSVSFKDISKGLEANLPSDWMVASIHLDDLAVTAARQQLLDAMNRGTALVTFTGHSGPTSWTFSSLFTTSHAAQLTNVGKPFVAVQWGCWNTYYVDPVNNYLVQSLLFSGDRGAAAALGAVTLTEAESERLLGELLTPRMVQPGVRLGDALQQAKAELAQTNPDLLDVLLGWTLMGDPTLTIVP